MKLIIKYSDYIGASASGLCFIHCLATPILFLSQASLVSIGNEMLFLWQSLNFFLLTISAIAVYYSIKNSSSLSVNTLLFLTWFILLCLIITEVFEIFSVPEFYSYITAISLSGLHIYNLKYCRCDNEECCTS
jgi:hypothetical protein